MQEYINNLKNSIQKLPNDIFIDNEQVKLLKQLDLGLFVECVDKLEEVLERTDNEIYKQIINQNITQIKNLINWSKNEKK